eukprot:CAMPEP_0177787260 /NCGR_PEP_ID=MMETSP0491_2-20121128/21384_1 /TAXON_ID=63592 /ORGANISM="Tetraselmis chuii, Strain PLY429" /LENGTH=51 /DNA_ID=CAMNT_0019308571 /DNA_START=1 /DNA_END=154 /DNA_ORIENTATION=+
MVAKLAPFTPDTNTGIHTGQAAGRFIRAKGTTQPPIAIRRPVSRRDVGEDL